MFSREYGAKRSEPGKKRVGSLQPNEHVARRSAAFVPSSGRGELATKPRIRDLFDRPENRVFQKPVLPRPGIQRSISRFKCVVPDLVPRLMTGQIAV